jgi:hypothetical protein
MYINGRAAVSLNGKWGVIDEKGNLKAPCKYDKIGAFNAEDFAIVHLNGKLGMLHKDGKLTVPAIYDDVVSINNHVAYARKNGNWGVIETNGKVVIELEYPDIEAWDLYFKHSHGHTFFWWAEYRTIEGRVYGKRGDGEKLMRGEAGR